jgi:hypothetical protein
MSGLGVVILKDEARPRLEALARSLGPGGRRPLMGALGRTLEKELRAWFAAANGQKVNRQGWKRQNFWRQIRSATAYDPARTTETEAVVTIADPRLRPHVYGGEIRPKEAKYLAIPVHRAAYGLRPSEGRIAGLRFVPVGRTANTVGYLVRREGRGPDAPVVSYYRLVRRVRVRPDPSALPPAGLTTPALLAAAERHVLRSPA